ncbi:MAG: hypothetical protein HFE67_09155, partial [Erysipelotrichaceae bacterium]|nr:hypothetical protein [Erysipelotrichaceae bacterium]
MLRKIGVSLFILVVMLGTVSFYLNYMMNAAGGTQGNLVTARIQQAPSNLSGAKAEIGFKAGDKIAIQAGGGDNAWQLETYHTYTTYDCEVVKFQETAPLRCSNPAISAWFAMTTKPLAENHPFTNHTNMIEDPWVRFYANRRYYGWLKDNHVLGAEGADLPYDSFISAEKVELLNQQLLGTGENVLLTFHDESCFFSLVEGGIYNNPNDRLSSLFGDSSPDTFGKKAVIPSYCDITNVNQAQRAFSSDYWLTIASHTKLTYGDSARFVNAAGQMLAYTQNRSVGGTVNVSNFFEVYASTRGGADLDLSNVVFAASAPIGGSGLKEIQATPANLVTTSSNVLQDTNQFDDMIVRILDSSMSVGINQTAPFYHASKNQELAKQSGTHVTMEGTKIRIKASGSAGGTISAVIFDQQGTPLFYEPLGAATGTETLYDLDTSTLSEGTYQIAVVNEELPNDRTPSKSSAFSNAYVLKITEGIKITPSVRSGLEYKKNVNLNDIVASLSASGGVAPMSYTLISDNSVAGHENDYQKFAISGNNIVVNEPNGINAGDYYFKVSAVDANGYPLGGVESSVIHVIVSKTSLTVSFDLPNQTKKSITEAQNGWSEMASATPNTGTKVAYTKVGGDISLINIDPDSGAITFSGTANSYGKITIQAIADDDPSTGND